MAPKLIPQPITQHSHRWMPFLAISYACMQESWPQKYENTDKEGFIRSYGDKLIQRMREGVRGLFLYYRKENVPLGFSNVYLSGEKKEVLNIAEFYVVPNMRRKGLGKEILGHVTSWGKKQGVQQLSIEVNKELENANRFWSSFSFQRDSSRLRNLYFCAM